MTYVLLVFTEENIICMLDTTIILARMTRTTRITDSNNNTNRIIQLTG